MYVPPRYRMTDDAVIDAILRDNGFMTIVTAGGGGLMASHVPIELVRDPSGGRLLRGHLARANPQWRELKGIVGFEVRVRRIEAAFKLSQNRHAEDYARIVSSLLARGDDQSRAVATAMRAVLPPA